MLRSLMQCLPLVAPPELQENAAFWDQVYAREVDRRTVKGIHGILHTHPKAKISILEQTAN